MADETSTSNIWLRICHFWTKDIDKCSRGGLPKTGKSRQELTKYGCWDSWYVCSPSCLCISDGLIEVVILVAGEGQETWWCKEIHSPCDLCWPWMWHCHGEIQCMQSWIEFFVQFLALLYWSISFVFCLLYVDWCGVPISPNPIVIVATKQWENGLGGPTEITQIQNISSSSTAQNEVCTKFPNDMLRLLLWLNYSKEL